MREIIQHKTILDVHKLPINMVLFREWKMEEKQHVMSCCDAITRFQQNVMRLRFASAFNNK